MQQERLTHDGLLGRREIEKFFRTEISPFKISSATFENVG